MANREVLKVKTWISKLILIWKSYKLPSSFFEVQNFENCFDTQNSESKNYEILVCVNENISNETFSASWCKSQFVSRFKSKAPITTTAFRKATFYSTKASHWTLNLLPCFSIYWQKASEMNWVETNLFSTEICYFFRRSYFVIDKRRIRFSFILIAFQSIK